MKKLIYNYIEDICIFSGAVMIIAAAFLMSVIAGLIVCGSTLIALGVYLAKCTGH